MIILGLGSNMGDRIENLRAAYSFIKNSPDFTIIATSPLYQSEALLKEGAEENWNRPFLNAALHCHTALSPAGCLDRIKQIESLLGREKPRAKWAPRLIDIDILAWGNEIIELPHLHIPHRHLLQRPFALWPLSDLLPLWRYPVKNEKYGQRAFQLVEKWGSRFNGQAPYNTQQISQRIDTPALIGILNLTPNSFSDGNQYQTVDHAIQKAKEMVKGGAEIIDIGGESTAPQNAPIAKEIEWQRIESVIAMLIKEKNHFHIQPKISVDTYHTENAEKALSLGVDWINDVTGLTNPRMQALIAESGAECIMMHHLTVPPQKEQVLAADSNPIHLIYNWAEERLKILSRVGITPKKIIFDPGIGFGKNAPHSLLLLKNINQFEKLGVRLLIGHSRKSFMNLFTAVNAKERDIETIALSLYLAQTKINYLRIHAVSQCARAFHAFAAISASLTV